MERTPGALLSTSEDGSRKTGSDILARIFKLIGLPQLRLGRRFLSLDHSLLFLAPFA